MFINPIIHLKTKTLDYMPSNDAKLITWGKNLATEAPGVNDTLKLPAEQVKQVMAANNTMDEKTGAAVIAMAAATKALVGKGKQGKLSKQTPMPLQAGKSQSRLYR